MLYIQMENEMDRWSMLYIFPVFQVKSIKRTQASNIANLT